MHKTLSEKQRKYLRRLAHPMHPLVMLGNAGLTEAIIAELDGALSAHELVKVSARVGEREARNAALEELASRTGAQLVQRVGHIGVLYRPRPLAKIILPDT
jgi:RNA-binding protein